MVQEMGHQEYYIVECDPDCRIHISDKGAGVQNIGEKCSQFRGGGQSYEVQSLGPVVIQRNKGVGINDTYNYHNHFSRKYCSFRG
jgi:hypothetical protein